MANWNLPTVTSNYLNVLTELNAKDVDAATMFKDTPSNQPEGAMRYNRSTNILEESLSSVWTAKALAVAGGGTGATTAANARTNLGLGSIATQNSNNVSISGGSITGLSTFTVAGNITPTSDGTRDLGTNALQFRYGYIRTGFKIPVGVDAYIPS